MATQEFEKREEYLAFVNNPVNPIRIRSIELYWSEGRGTRKTKVLPGRNVKAYWDGLKLTEQIHQVFGMPRELQEAFRKDYDENGGMTELEGKPEDAVIVVEYDDAV